MKIEIGNKNKIKNSIIGKDNKIENSKSSNKIVIDILVGLFVAIVSGLVVYYLTK